HGVFEEDGPQNALAGEVGAGDDARAHVMHEIKHLVVILPGVVFDPVERQRMGGAAATLIQCRNEPRLGLHLLHLLGRSHGGLPLVTRWLAWRMYPDYQLAAPGPSASRRFPACRRRACRRSACDRSTCSAMPSHPGLLTASFAAFS